MQPNRQHMLLQIYFCAYVIFSKSLKSLKFHPQHFNMSAVTGGGPHLLLVSFLCQHLKLHFELTAFVKKSIHWSRREGGMGRGGTTLDECSPSNHTQYRAQTRVTIIYACMRACTLGSYRLHGMNIPQHTRVQLMQKCHTQKMAVTHDIYYIQSNKRKCHHQITLVWLLASAPLQVHRHCSIHDGHLHTFAASGL